MSECDRRTIAGGTPGPALVDRAGRAVAWEVRRVLGGLYGQRAVVVCGQGNNGNDGRVAAAVLRGWGVRTDVLALPDGPDAPDLDASVIERALARADVLVD